MTIHKSYSPQPTSDLRRSFRVAHYFSPRHFRGASRLTHSVQRAAQKMQYSSLGGLSATRSSSDKQNWRRRCFVARYVVIHPLAVVNTASPRRNSRRAVWHQSESGFIEQTPLAVIAYWSASNYLRRFWHSLLPASTSRSDGASLTPYAANHASFCHSRRRKARVGGFCDHRTHDAQPPTGVAVIGLPPAISRIIFHISA